jgi:hypothetical protein
LTFVADWHRPLGSWATGTGCEDELTNIENGEAAATSVGEGEPVGLDAEAELASVAIERYSVRHDLERGELVGREEGVERIARPAADAHDPGCGADGGDGVDLDRLPEGGAGDGVVGLDGLCSRHRKVLQIIE